MIYLASQSPRRAELLRLANIPFQQFSVDIDETVLANEIPLSYLKRVITLKRIAAEAICRQQDKPILVADTIVALEGEILTKPLNFETFCDYMSKLSGKWHQVLTVFALSYQGKVHEEVSISEVLFARLLELEIKQYWRTGEPQDKAGGYAIQGVGARFVKAFKGDFNNIIGLPIDALKKALDSLEIPMTKS
ncbi:Maf family protein [Fastidiosibacter lacustris]|uniref:Maf family protein n=1 Tax=Fastidiosibacter lacustris TaxID=2056695 RepID=UPI000E344F1D|nr:nucleoside triphosphate pyrophosphatase [Fastidiosibacter lacustris]